MLKGEGKKSQVYREEGDWTCRTVNDKLDFWFFCVSKSSGTPRWQQLWVARVSFPRCFSEVEPAPASSWFLFFFFFSPCWRNFLARRCLCVERVEQALGGSRKTGRKNSFKGLLWCVQLPCSDSDRRAQTSSYSVIPCGWQIKGWDLRRSKLHNSTEAAMRSSRQRSHAAPPQYPPVNRSGHWGVWQADRSSAPAERSRHTAGGYTLAFVFDAWAASL